jgi:hypothetical protein
MPEERAITDCREIQPGWWQIDTQLPDGSIHLHAFPLEALEWRAAEYAIPLTDADTLIDIIVHERLLTEPQAALQAAPTAEAARTAHLQQIQDVKDTLAHVRPRPAKHGSDVLQTLRDAHHAFATAEHVRAKAEYVDEIRRTHAARNAGVAAGREPFRNPRHHTPVPTAPRSTDHTDREATP